MNLGFYFRIKSCLSFEAKINFLLPLLCLYWTNNNNNNSLHLYSTFLLFQALKVLYIVKVLYISSSITMVMLYICMHLLRVYIRHCLSWCTEVCNKSYNPHSSCVYAHVGWSALSIRRLKHWHVLFINLSWVYFLHIFILASVKILFVAIAFGPRNFSYCLFQWYILNWEKVV